MAELTKLNYLYKGLDRGLLRQIYPLQPVTCADFLTKVKVFTTTELLANQQFSQEREVRSLADKLNEEVNLTINCLRMDNIKKEQEKEELQRQIKQLQQQEEMSVKFMRLDTSEEEELKRNYSNPDKSDYYEDHQDQDTYSSYGYGYQDASHNGYSSNEQCNSNSLQRPWDPDIQSQHSTYFNPYQGDCQPESFQESSNGRSQNDPPNCFYCGKPGHIKRYCFNNPNSQNYKGQQGYIAEPIQKQIFKMNLTTKNTMKEKVLCGRQEVEGVVDTAAEISAIDYEFLKQTPFAMQK